ncbi:hypothetical protein [Nostoc sp.]|uniref:hypothetical protein n=1 Tax=Nostoc sp. TaxID=1180 RepID=UPI002FFCDC19
MRGLALQSLKYCDKYNCHNQSLWLGINHGDRSYGTAIAFLLDQPAISSMVIHSGSLSAENQVSGEEVKDCFEGTCSATPVAQIEKSSN